MVSLAERGLVQIGIAGHLCHVSEIAVIASTSENKATCVSTQGSLYLVVFQGIWMLNKPRW
jgi:hypothetical protein